ncbi:hypothetical protein Bca101_050365 [Brassica carinata]
MLLFQDGTMAKYEYHLLGKTWVCWTDNVVVTWLQMSAHVVTCAIQIPSTGEQFICSAVYTFNTVAEGTQLWEELQGTRAAYSNLSLPWIIIGDFNKTLASSEHSRAQDY